jgi:glucosamine--fructose-6-phosphate aminotransferase (isomerizing)
MRNEILEIPEAVERILSKGEDVISDAAESVRTADPSFLISVARGTSDHACTFLKYASELLLRRPVASVGPSVNSIYGVDVLASNAVAISISQSGQSPDIVNMIKSLKESCPLTIAITNNADSRLANEAGTNLPMHAGPELSVAATKTFVTSLVVGLWLIAEIKRDRELLSAIRALPDQLASATRCDWSEAAAAIDGSSLYTLGRGPSLAISNEAALKFKETCLIHAESYSTAEVLHGPVAIVDRRFPVISFAAADCAEKDVANVSDELALKGAKVFTIAGGAKHANPLPCVRTGHWLTDPIAAIVSFYGMVESVAVGRGINPDKPRNLKKVTETL